MYFGYTHHPGKSTVSLWKSEIIHAAFEKMLFKYLVFSPAFTGEGTLRKAGSCKSSSLPACSSESLAAALSVGVSQ